MLRLAAARSRTCLPQRRSIFSLPKLVPLGSAKSSPSVFHTRKILPYTQRQLYNLVADVDSYHRFLPFCTGSRVLTPVPEGSSAEEPYRVEAELSVGFMGMRESYTSMVLFKPYEQVQAIASSSKLFKSLETIWRFQPASASSPHLSSSPPPHSASVGTNKRGTDAGPTLLSVDLEYEFANPLHATIISGSFERVSELMVQAFEKRCLDVYGKGGA